MQKCDRFDHYVDALVEARKKKGLVSVCVYMYVCMWDAYDSDLDSCMPVLSRCMGLPTFPDSNLRSWLDSNFEVLHAGARRGRRHLGVPPWCAPRLFLLNKSLIPYFKPLHANLRTPARTQFPNPRTPNFKRAGARRGRRHDEGRLQLLWRHDGGGPKVA